MNILVRDVLEIDVCLIAGRRPDLLLRTLGSFNKQLFQNFKIQRFIANIDPIFGDEADQKSCVDIINDLFPNAEISTPDKAGFTAAVRRNWSKIKAPLALHLEDDWVLQHAIGPADLAAFHRDDRLAQICFNHADKRWPIGEKGPYAYGRKRLTIFGMKTPLKSARMSIFTTSPGFLRGPFARRCAEIMDDRFDPEKQFYKSVNPALERYVADFRSLVLGDAPNYPILDIGRDWRGDRNINKQYDNWQSVWTEAP
ncbi:hypothetical protein [Mycoplana ramosa]|uniref:Uncharacterized protein n=1 Tax=Mycoplana ramosa TaxID=40837 RepID=A0ABW3YSV1_MYCRA